MSTNSRFIFIDSARGLAILLVVLGHAIQYTVQNFDENHAFRFIYAVHMPLFMFISGYLTRAGTQKNATRLLSKAHSLLLPFLSWIPISYISILYLQQPKDFTADIIDFTINIVKSPDSGGLWFLLVLFECHLIMLASEFISKQKQLAIAITILISLNIILIKFPFCNLVGLGLLRWQLLFFLIGFIAQKNNWKPPTQKTSVMFLMIFIVLASFWHRKSATLVELLLPNLGEVEKRLAVQGYHAITALAGIAAILGICEALTKYSSLSLLRKLLSKIGQVSLEIYAGHYIFLYAAVRISDSRINGEITRILAVALFAFSFAWVLSRALEVNPISRKLFYGRK